jgi:hypothetical protein
MITMLLVTQVNLVCGVSQRKTKFGELRSNLEAQPEFAK